MSKELPITASKIKELRRNMDLTQSEFVLKINEDSDGSEYTISEASLKKYEQGSALPINAALLIAKKCSVSLDWLYGLDKNQSTDNTNLDDFVKGEVILRAIIKLMHYQIFEFSENEDGTISLNGTVNYWDKECGLFGNPLSYFSENKDLIGFEILPELLTEAYHAMEIAKNATPDYYDWIMGKVYYDYNNYINNGDW